MNTTLRKLPMRRYCQNCAVTYSDDINSVPCGQCIRNPNVKDNWRPDLPTAEKLVIWYAEQKTPISATEISKVVGGYMKSNPIIVEGAIAELIKKGKLKVETSVVIVKK